MSLCGQFQVRALSNTSTLSNSNMVIKGCSNFHGQVVEPYLIVSVGNPITWLFPSWTSNSVREEESCIDDSSGPQPQADDGFPDPDYEPPADVVSPSTPSHSYNLRPRR